MRAGEVAVVFGQGVVGNLCGRIARRSAGKLIVVDPILYGTSSRSSTAPTRPWRPEDAAEAIAELSDGRGADVTFEASGSAPALQATFGATAEYGTIAVLSYFGSNPVPLVLAPEFHWKRQTIISSNAGTRPRWTPERRTEAILGMLEGLGVDSLISRHVPFEDAPEAYRLVDEHPADVLGVVLDYWPRGVEAPRSFSDRSPPAPRQCQGERGCRAGAGRAGRCP